MTPTQRAEPATLDDQVDLCGRLAVTVDGRRREAELGRQGRLVIARLALEPRPRGHPRAAHHRAVGRRRAARVRPAAQRRAVQVAPRGRRRRRPGRPTRTACQLAPGGARRPRGGDGAVSTTPSPPPTAATWAPPRRTPPRVLDELAAAGVMPGTRPTGSDAPRRRLREAGLKAGELLAQAGLAARRRPAPGRRARRRGDRRGGPAARVGARCCSCACAPRRATRSTPSASFHELRRVTIEELGRAPGAAVDGRARASPAGRAAAASAAARDARPSARSSPRAAAARSSAAAPSSSACASSSAARPRATRRLLLVDGEPGIGKTRLALQLMSACESDGALGLYGRCDAETLVGYQPFVEALRR